MNKESLLKYLFAVDPRLKETLHGKVVSAEKKHREKIAVIGSGPAGLTAAFRLAEKGYPVKVFESHSEAGGMLRVGIPWHRLPKELLDAETEFLKGVGVEVETNVRVGEDVNVDKLFKEGYKVIFLATGAHKSRKLGVEGEDLKGVVHGLELLKRVNTGERVKIGERVAVIGGGNVAVDVARTALRIGARDVSILYRRSRAEMPADPWKVEEAEREGVKTVFLVAPKRILGEKGRVVGVELVRMRLGEPDESGRRRPVPVRGSEFVVQLDTVIPAIGEAPETSFLPEGVELTRRGTIAVDPETMMTNVPGLFAGGDAVAGPSTVIEAMADGEEAASAINRYLKKRTR